MSPGSRAVARLFAFTVATLCFLVAAHTLLLGFLSPARSLPLGLGGDQSFYLWALERAIRSESYAAFIRNCSWSNQYCFDLRAVPQEWNNLFAIGSIARWLHQDSFHAIFAWYFMSLFLNVIAATLFIGTVSGNWILAGALGVAVGLHESVLVRTAGHFSLVAIWPAILALTFFWKTLEAMFLRGRGYLFGLVPCCLSVFLTVWTSFYYTVFSLVLFVATSFSFYLIHYPRVSWRRVVGAWRPLGVCGIFALLTVVLSVYPARYLIIGAGGEKHTSSHVRVVEDVWRYSAHWADYVRPSPFSAAFFWLSKIGVHVWTPDPRVASEVHSFLGATFVAFFLWACGLLYRRWRTARQSPEAAGLDRRPLQRECLTLFAAFLFVVFFSTFAGGLLIHQIFKATRCFGRMAPYAALFGATFVARTLVTTGKGPYVVALVFCLGFTVEASTQALVHRRSLIGTSAIESLVQKLAQECQTRDIQIVPEAGDYMNGPYLVYFLAERAGCRISGIDGPGKHVTSSVRLSPAKPMIFRWQPQGGPIELEVEGHPPVDLRSSF